MAIASLTAISALPARVGWQEVGDLAWWHDHQQWANQRLLRGHGGGVLLFFGCALSADPKVAALDERLGGFLPPLGPGLPACDPGGGLLLDRADLQAGGTTGGVDCSCDERLQAGCLGDGP